MCLLCFLDSVTEPLPTIDNPMVSRTFYQLVDELSFKIAPYLLQHPEMKTVTLTSTQILALVRGIDLLKRRQMVLQERLVLPHLHHTN